MQEKSLLLQEVEKAHAPHSQEGTLGRRDHALQL